MMSKTPSILNRLSPLAAAIAFALTAPSLAYSKNFVIDTDKDNEDDGKTSLREAIAKINEAGEKGDHTITFDSSLSGKTIEMDSVYLNNSKLTVDGSGAEDLTLSFSRYNYVSIPGRGSELARRSTYAAVLAYYSELTLENVDLLIVGEQPPRRPEARFPAPLPSVMAVYAFDTEVNLNNVSMSSTEESYGETSAMQLLDSNVTISNSSFTKFNAPKYGASLGFMAFGNSGETEFSLNVVNSTFEDNESKYGGSAGIMVSVYSDRVYSVEDGFSPVSVSANVLIKDSSFNNNYAFFSLGTALSFNSDTSEYGEGAGQISSLSLALEGVTISNNKSRFGLGAITMVSESSDTEFAIVNSTIAENESKYGSAFAGIFNTTGTEVDVAIAHTTITNNKSPIDYSPREDDKYESSPAVIFSVYGEDDINHLEIANSIIANNERTTHENGDFMYGEKITIDSDIQLETNKNKIKMNVRNSLIGVEEFIKAEDNPYGYAVGSRIIGSDNLMGVDPMLGDLIDNGGLTLTIAPLEGSPVINAGNTALVEEYELETDQRGRERILAGAPDMGAVEFCESDGDCTYEKKSGGLFGSFGIHYLTAALGLAWLRRRKQA